MTTVSVVGKAILASVCALSIVWAASSPANAVGVGAATIRDNVVDFLSSEETGHYRVSVTEIGGAGREFSIDGPEAVEPASTFKVFIAWRALARIDSGRVSLRTRLASGLTWKKCLTLMVVVSDNLCAVDLREAVGDRSINRALTRFGFDNSRILLTGSGAYAGKRTSVADLTQFFVRLENVELLTDRNTERLQSLFRRQIWRKRIGRGIPQGVIVESKPGLLATASGLTNSDAGIVRGEGSTYVISVLGTNDARAAAIRHISRIVYEGMTGDTEFESATYPLRQFTVAAGTRQSTTAFGSPVATFTTEQYVHLIATERNRALIRSSAFGRGWVDYSALTVRSEFRWLG